MAVVEAVPFNVGSYTLGLVDVHGHLEATAKAQTPSGYVVAAVPSLTSVSNDRLYYEDGDANVDYLTPDGRHGVAFSVPRPSGAVLAFAVSPDDSEVAVGVLNGFVSGAASVTADIYTMHLAGGARHDLYHGSATSTQDPMTWPVGWHGGQLIVAQSPADDFSGMSSQNVCSPRGVGCAAQLRTYDPVTRSFGPALCAGAYEQPSGLPTPSGIACEMRGMAGAGPAPAPQPDGLVAYSWFGERSVFAENVTLYDNDGCLLSPHGTLIGCPTVIDNPQTNPMTYPARLFKPNGQTESLPLPMDEQMIGWIDGNDVVVTTGVNSDGLAVQDLVSGTRTPFSIPATNRWIWQCEGVIPGAL